MGSDAIASGNRETVDFAVVLPDVNRLNSARYCRKSSGSAIVAMDAGFTAVCASN
jgi:hypothetical protein